MSAVRGWGGAALVVAVMALPACTGSSGSDASESSESSPDGYVIDGCERADLGGRSVARVWDEALLDAIRRDVPAPTVHARNLFHTSAAMWDAWAAYDPDGDGYFVDEKQEADDVGAAREAAISYAAYRVLLHRYSRAAGLQATFDELVATMESLCYRTDFTSTEGDSPAALGNRIAAAVIAAGRDDGALEERRYTDTTYRPVNQPLVVADPGAPMRDPNRWQPLALARQVAQNGQPIPGNIQRFVGPHWGRVDTFGLSGSAEGLPVDPGPPPQLGGDAASADAFKQAAVAVLRDSSVLDPADGATIDIGPGAIGDNPLGTNDGDGHDVNPSTGEPYAPNEVRRGDFARALAEFWADGPDSETPPGHWNSIANEVSDTPSFVRRIGGDGPELDRLEWDVKLYFALNGAVHDAAVAAWGVKGYYDSARPISMIRYMGAKGQSSDPAGAAYDPDGLPLVPGLIEVVTPASSAGSQRHEHLADHLGEVAVRAWRGNPGDPADEASGVGWIRAVDWVPYQRATFVTPAFAGYVSGHSTFSRAAAEVMSAFTGDPYFPGGISQWTVPAGDLVTEAGPSRDVTLQWATYFDAADQAGISRIFGGIHIPADDFEGRRIGTACGRAAWSLAQRYFAGTVPA
ncbi:MAG TPA: vanadium-dependent haloperoxidase [Acidimicrobiales bacterium]|nr:vanadium-dependent haloperoxidase [Acidimicrobiales bacterium]